VCPLHRYRFSLANGRNTSGEGYFLKTYPVKEDDDGVWVGLEVG
jgi:3-phenylpropionate/trans-cinnamate dioxygenase ferredoxin subunit